MDERTGAMFSRRTEMTVLAYRFHWVTSSEQAGGWARELRDQPKALADNLWGYVDIRDAAAACRLGLEAGVSGFEVFNVTAADTLAFEPTEEMIWRYCPHTELRGRIEGHASGFSIEKPRKQLGWTPQHSWWDET